MLRLFLIFTVVLGAILYIFLPEEQFLLFRQVLLTYCFGVTTSLTASVLLDKRHLRELTTDIWQLYYGQRIKLLFKNKVKGELLITSLEQRVSKTLRKKALSKEFINNVDPEFNAAILLSLQKMDICYAVSSDLTHLDFKTNARKAYEFKPYRKLLLSDSLKGLKLDYEQIVDELLDNSESAVGNELKNVSDVEFLNKLKEASSDTLIIFSTTSQLSSDIIDALVNFPKHVKKIEFFVCSPYIKTDKAIQELTKEYSPHNFCLEEGQFITKQGEKTIDIEMDCTRRVFRILSSITRLKEFSRQQGIDVDINFFKQQYAGVKIKFLKDRGFLQIQPGPLTFANNTYRFGVTSDSSSICRKVYDSIMELKQDTSLIEVVNFSSLDTKVFEIRVIKELATWLLERGVTAEKVREYIADFSLRIKDVNVFPWIEYIDFMLSGSRNYINNFSFDVSGWTDSLTEVLDNGSGEQIYCDFVGTEQVHKTVALLIVKDDSVLLIEKNDPAYHSKFSIVAGHVNNKETIQDALVREAKEEIGLDIKEPDFLFQMKKVRETCRYKVNLHDWYVFHYSKYNEAKELVPDSSEIKSIKWVKLIELENMKNNLTPGCKALFVNMGYIK